LAEAKKERIHTLFEAIVQRYPDGQAVLHKAESVTYKILNEKANYVAQCLLEKGISQGEVVAVKQDKDIDLIVSILALLKAGAAYLPIDPAYPAARIDYMLEDSQARYVLTSTRYLGAHKAVTEINIDGLQGRLTDAPLVPQEPDDLAYVIYTSGTTGNPKGVMVGHAGFVNMCLYQIAVYQLGVYEKVLQFASISFDAAVYETFIALLSGATLVLADKKLILDHNLFLDYIDTHGITFILLPPVFLSSLGRPELKTVKTIVTAGEACNVADAVHYSKTKRFFNAYGPTEASVCVSLYQVTPHKAYSNYIPVGKAIPSITFYILSEELTPVKEGETGELYIGGIGLAKGYMNQPELTQKFFMENPGKPGERIYRTGDIVKKTDEGNLIILGRKDDQVKILGHRIELGAITHALLQLPVITDAHVDALEHEGDKYLCAYFTATEDIQAERIRERLLAELPAFMMPHWFVQLPAFRMTSNGKIDKKALPSPFKLNEAVSTDPVKEQQPESTQERLLSMCKEVLGIRQLGLSDHFFLLGGHSLKAARLSAKISQAFQVELPVVAIYQNPHIAQLIELIQTSKKLAYKPITSAPLKQYYATSAAQKRMYVMHSTDQADVSYNVSIVLQFENTITKDALITALEVLSDRHEVLRTRFDIQQDEIVQQVLPRVAVSLLDGGTLAAGELAAVAKRFVRPFDLSTAPILKVGYYRLVGGGTAILFDTHHIIADGTSIGILVREFVQLLNGEPLPELSLQYKDYAEWENRQYAAGDYFVRHEQYWLNMYQTIPRLTMPVDPNRSASRQASGERLSYRIESELTSTLRQYALDMDVSMYQLLLSVYYLLLAQYTQQQDIVVGTAVANRRREEVQSMMGMFVNTLALRTRVSPQTSFGHFVQSIKNMVLEAFEHQEYPFEKLISQLGLSGNANKVPLIDTLFIVQNIDFFSEQATGGLTLKYENATATSKFDFSFFIVEYKDTLVLEVEYNTNLFGRPYMDKLAQNFIELADKAVSNPVTLLEEITLIDSGRLADLRTHLATESTIADVEFDL